MPAICLNCGTELTGKYCSNCGQKADVKRLDWHSLGEEVLHFFTHIEKGFLKTTAQLIIRPDRLSKNYLDGKRKQYHKPIGFFLIWITIFTLVYHGAHSITHFTNQISKSGGNNMFNFGMDQFRVLGEYRSIIELMILPISALISWLFIGWGRLNYAEVLSVFFYFIAFLFIWMTVQYTGAVILGINFKTTLFDMISTGGFLAWFVIAGYCFYRQYRVSYLVPRIVISLAVAGVAYFLLMGLIVNQLIGWGF